MSGDDKRPLMPRLRFAEFRDAGEWGFQPLSQLAKRSTRKNVDGQHSRVLTNSAEQGVVDQRDYFDKDIANQGNLEGYYIVEKGDYVYNPRISSTAPVGPISRNNIGAGVMSPLYTVFRFDSSENDFYAQYFRSTHWHRYLRQRSSTGARHDRMSITNDDFMGLPLPVSSPTEQQKIADCLSSLDELIAAEAKMLGALKAQREGVMQQLFPAEGETVPRRRFPEFQIAPVWEWKTLGKVAEISSGTTPLRSESKFHVGGSIPWVKTTDLNNSLILHTEELITHHAKARVNPVGSVLVAMYGGFNQIGRTGLLGIPAATNQAISVLGIKQSELLPRYLQIWLNAKVSYWKRIASSSRKDPNITSMDVAKFPVAYPKRGEQERIADCLSTLDDLIASRAQKIQLLKRHKNGLMQQLFPVLDEEPVA
jgi:type I restriction enzyme, S subunit